MIASYNTNSRVHVDMYRPMVHVQNPTGSECTPLDGNGGDQHVESEAAESVSFQECHQEAEPDEYHDVDILEHCKEETNYRS